MGVVLIWRCRGQRTRAQHTTLDTPLKQQVSCRIFSRDVNKPACWLQGNARKGNKWLSISLWFKTGPQVWLEGSLHESDKRAQATKEPKRRSCTCFDGLLIMLS